MYILDEIKVDSAGRVNVSKLFDEVPREVIILCDTKEKAIFFRECVQDDWLAVQRKVDSKNRITLPKWIRAKFGEVYYLVPDSKERHCLLAKTLRL